ncbi:hypothetical protein NX059_003813 [Plenodomus lindquistii]|nr:hypothetical protein NX059_003813 [Plenodomus lindquistii]
MLYEWGSEKNRNKRLFVVALRLTSADEPGRTRLNLRNAFITAQIDPIEYPDDDDEDAWVGAVCASLEKAKAAQALAADGAATEAAAVDDAALAPTPMAPPPRPSETSAPVSKPWSSTFGVPDHSMALSSSPSRPSASEFASLSAFFGRDLIRKDAKSSISSIRARRSILPSARA